MICQSLREHNKQHEAVDESCILVLFYIALWSELAFAVNF